MAHLTLPNIDIFPFPCPLWLILPMVNGMMTVEIAIATYETTLRGERLIEKLTTFAPKMRSAINLVLAEQVHADVNTVAKRNALESKLLAAIKPVIDGTKAREAKWHHRSAFYQICDFRSALMRCPGK